MRDFVVQRMLVHSIVEELRRAFRFLHPCDQNSPAYSVALYSVILQAASASERLIKLRCAEMDVDCNMKTAGGRQIVADGLMLAESGVVFHDWLGGREFFPFLPWRTREPTPWWENYNDVKHNSLASLQSSTLETAVFSVSASILALGPHLLSHGTTWLHDDSRSGPPENSFTQQGFSIIAHEDFWANHRK